MASLVKCCTIVAVGVWFSLVSSSALTSSLFVAGRFSSTHPHSASPSFQNICDQCLKGFTLADRLRTHRVNCAQCPTCLEWVDKRHIARGCTGRKRSSQPRVICYLCDRLRVKRDMKRHMLRKHGLKGWSEDPLRPLQTEVRTYMFRLSVVAHDHLTNPVLYSLRRLFFNSVLKLCCSRSKILSQS